MPSLSVTEAFSSLHDPRQAVKVEHKLLDMITIAICGVICGARGWTDIADIGRERLAWFRTELGLALPHGIPSHDTFGTVFRMLDAAVFHECFFGWMRSADVLSAGNVVNIDGKTLRRSHDRQKGIAALHMVSAFASEQGLVLGQLATEEKSNEITAIPELLTMLMLKGCIVTIDAMGTQTAIVETIRKQGADYLLPVKGNQSTLLGEITASLEKAFAKQWRGVPHNRHQTVDTGHGRIETRTCWAIALPTSLAELSDRWLDLTSIACIEAERTINGVISCERRFYITSLLPDAELILASARAHWCVENKLHWRLDVQMREDECRIRGDGAEMFAVIRHIALNQLQTEKTFKRGVNGKQLKACLNEEYLAKVFFAQ